MSKVERRANERYLSIIAALREIADDENADPSDWKTALWHGAYVRWFDHFEDGHHRRAWAWARIADGLSWALWGSR